MLKGAGVVVAAGLAGLPATAATGGGEVARYIGRHGTRRVAKAVLIGAIPPLMLKTPTNPGGLPIAVFDQIRAAVQGRSMFRR
jgi:non-heme chloroperoxidase